jgi:alkaline phosphatase D
MTMIASLAVSLLAAAAAPQAQPQSNPAPLTHGPFRGHVDGAAMHVWARAAAPGEHRLELLPRAGGAPVAAAATATADNDLTLHFRASGLARGVAYGVRIVRGDVVVHEDLAAGWTAGLPDDAGAATVAFGSCANDRGVREQPIWGRILARNPDALVLLGDTPYIDSGEVDARRRRHQDFFDQPAIAATLRRVPTWTTWDDHDYALNDQFGDVKSAATARAVFVDYHAHAGYGDGARGVWTSFRQGPIEVFLLDPRTCADTGPSPLAPNARTALGAAQIEWLQQGLRASAAPVKVLASGMVWNGGVRPGKKDCWGNWAEERDALFRWIGDAGIEGVVLVSGDVHRSRVIVHPTRALAGYDLPEFVTSPLAGNVLDENNVAVPGLRFDAGEPHSCMLLAVDSAAGDLDGGRLRASFQAGDGREFHAFELPLSRLSGLDAAPAYRVIAANLRARLGAELELPEFDRAEPGEPVQPPGPEWQPLLDAFAADLAAWHAVAGLRRCRFAPASKPGGDNEFLAEMLQPIQALLQLGDATAARALAIRDFDRVGRVIACQLGLANHLRDERSALGWGMACVAEERAAALLQRLAGAGAAAAPSVAAARAHLAARPPAAAVADILAVACERNLAGALATAVPDGSKEAAVAARFGDEVKAAFRAELAPLAAAARALGEPPTAEQLGAMQTLTGAWRPRMALLKRKWKALAADDLADPTLAQDLGFILLTMIAPPFESLHGEHIKVGAALADAVK